MRTNQFVGRLLLERALPAAVLGAAVGWPPGALLLMLIELDTMSILQKSSGFQESLFEALIQSRL